MLCVANWSNENRQNYKSLVDFRGSHVFETTSSERLKLVMKTLVRSLETECVEM